MSRWLYNLSHPYNFAEGFSDVFTILFGLFLVYFLTLSLIDIGRNAWALVRGWLGIPERNTFGDYYAAMMGRYFRQVHADELAEMERKGDPLWRPDFSRLPPP